MLEGNRALEEWEQVLTRSLKSLEERAGEVELPPGMKLVCREAWRTWRWAGSNAWLLGSLMAMSYVNGDAAQMYGSSDSNVSPSWYPMHLDSNVGVGSQPTAQKVLMGVDTLGTQLLSLCLIFIVGVTTGLWWKAYQKVEEVVRSKEIVMIDPPSPSTPPEPLTPPVTVGSSPRPLSRTATTVGTVKQYTLKEIEDMTDNFKVELGRGGQGIVYLATLLPEDQPTTSHNAAVKRLQKGATNLLNLPNLEIARSQEVIEKEFWAELNTISRLHHRNLVALLGYCFEEDDLFLVYEYMAKGSLDQHLHKNLDRDDGPSPLDWRARMRCAVEVAQGLEYLHSHANPSLVHRDIKSGNILFDEDMQAKIADFGLSKPLPPGHEVTVSVRVRGTHGYVDPVYLLNGQPCDKNDVYSYGVVLLELITGRRAVQQRISLVTWCKDFLGTDEPVMRHLLPRMVDSRISPCEYSYEQLHEVVMLAHKCVDEKLEHRPSMQDVVVTLYNANCKDYSSSDISIDSTMDFYGSNGGGSSIVSSLASIYPERPPAYNRSASTLPSYEIRDNTIVVKCTIGNHKIALRCKIWPTPKNFGMNKVEASLNGAFLWKKGLWWYNARSSRDFFIDDDIKVTAEWHVALRTSKHGLAAHDPRRNQGPFCVEYLGLKDEEGKSLIEYHGDRSPLPEPSKESDASKSGSGSAERRRSMNGRRSMISRHQPTPR